MRRALALLVAAGLVTACSSPTKARVYRVPSSSMEPTLECAQPALGCTADASDLVAARPYGKRSPRRFDIVVFTAPRLAMTKCGAGGTFIKRLIGLPGETVADKHGYIYVDGRLLTEPYITVSHRMEDGILGTWHVPAGEYFLLGDNRGSSCDSRVWGPVPRKSFIGAVYEIKRGRATIHIR